MQKIFKYIIITLMGYIVCNLIKNTSKENKEDKKNKDKIGLVINNDIKSINEKQTDKIMEVVRNIWIVIMIFMILIMLAVQSNNANTITWYLMFYWIWIKNIMCSFFIFSEFFFIFFVIYEDKIKSKIIKIIAWTCYFSNGTIASICFFINGLWFLIFIFFGIGFLLLFWRKSLDFLFNGC